VKPAVGRLPRRTAHLPGASPRRRSGGTHTGLRAMFLLALLGAVLLGLMVPVGVTVAAVATYQSVLRDLPSVAALPERPIFKTTQILDRHGNLLYEVFDQDAGKRTIVTLDDVPSYLVDATVATEDANFFTNPGVDPRGIVRAAWSNLEAGRTVAGGSTISQQLVKNVLIPPDERYEVNFGRKVREAVLAFQLSRTYSKQQILQMYLNEINYGNLAYGVEAAAQAYFGKPVHDVSLAEAAMLAGLPQAPSSYDPFKDPQAAKTRQGQVLDLMVRHGFLDAERAAAAKAEPLQYAPPNSNFSAPHFVMYVRDLLVQRYGLRGLFEGGLRVYTTLDLETQQLAEEMVAKHVATLARQDARNAGLIALDPRSGEVLAMVGSPDYYNAAIDGQVNATIADRQPGSAIKPIVYLAAFERGFGPSTVVLDQATRFPDGPNRFYTPENFDKRFRGAVTLRRALGNSLNIPAVKVLQFVGVRETVKLARALGLTSLSEDKSYGLSFTLGGTEVKLLELTGAYAALANGGRVVTPHAILRVEDSSGAVLDGEAEPPTTPAVDPRLVFQITDVLADNNSRLETFGVNNPLRLTRPAAVKTGSTDDSRDSWAVGYTPSLLAGVWVGNSDGRPMRFVLGSSGAGLIWHEFMERALEGEPVETFEPPPGLVRGTVCAQTGYLPGPECGRTVTDWFLAEHPPRAANAPRARVAINTRSNKLATAYCPLPEIQLRTFGGNPSGEGPYAPSDYCDLHGPQGGRAPGAWEGTPAPPTPTLAPASPTSTPTAASSRVPLGPTLVPLATWTATPAPTPTSAPTATRVVPTLGALPIQLMASLLAPTATPAVARQFHPWAQLPPAVAVSFPGADQPIDHRVPILGSASLPFFQGYTVQYGSGDDPSTWEPMGPPRTQPVQDGVLEIWDPSSLADGVYTLRVTVVDSYGQQQGARQRVRIQR
jgi:1A family penicillin-binding protein